MSTIPPQEAARIIEIAGGDRAFGQLLGIHDRPNYAQRVNNWKRRGLPSAIVLAHFQTIRRLRAKAAEEATQSDRESA